MMRSFKDFKLFLFDLDDTLASTHQAIDFACDETLIELSEVTGIAFESLRPLLLEFKALFGSSADKEYWSAFVEMLPCAGSIDATELTETYRRHYWNAFVPMPGALELLKGLVLAKKKVGIVSNGEPALQSKKLKELGFLPYIDPSLLFYSGSFLPDDKKPSPRMIERALQQADVEPCEAVYVGDRLTDVLSGNLAKVCSVAVRPIFIPEEMRAYSLFSPQFQMSLEQILLQIQP